MRVKKWRTGDSVVCANETEAVRREATGLSPPLNTRLAGLERRLGREASCNWATCAFFHKRPATALSGKPLHACGEKPYKGNQACAPVTRITRCSGGGPGGAAPKHVRACLPCFCIFKLVFKTGMKGQVGIRLRREFRLRSESSSVCIGTCNGRFDAGL